MRPRAVSGAREVGDSRRPRASPEHEAGHRPLHEAFCVPVGGEAQTKVAGPRPALSFPRGVVAPATAPRDRGLLQPERRCQPCFCACASRAWCLALPPTHFGSLHRDSPVLTNPAFAGALQGKRGVVNEK